MREILFRGKRTDNGEWVYGCFYQYAYVMGKGNYINTPDCEWEVIPETVGQYIGIDDKNGKKIFEGDIVRIEYEETTIEKAVIEYVGASFYGSTTCDLWELDGYRNIEVIGNIYD